MSLSAALVLLRKTNFQADASGWVTGGLFTPWKNLLIWWRFLSSF